jgi:hypothetical protein
MSEDHKLADTGDYNLFRYCHNDPIDLTDPMGLASDAINWGGNSPLNNHNMSAMEVLAWARLEPPCENRHLRSALESKQHKKLRKRWEPAKFRTLWQ